jgi:general secretion pathway protein K
MQAEGSGGLMGKQRGFALIVVLNVVAILAGIALVAAEGGREGSRIAGNFRAELEDRSFAEAGFARAAYGVAENQSSNRWILDGRFYAFDLLDRPVEIAIQDESGRLDLNTTDAATLAHAFGNVGIDPTSATILAGRIVDWRDVDSDRHLNGAENADYEAAGRPDLPPNMAFASLGELLDVLGMTNDVYLKIAPLVTVYASSGALNLDVAPVAVLDATFGPNSPAVSQFMRRRVAAAGLATAISGEGGQSNGLTPMPESAVATTYTVRIKFDGEKGKVLYQGAFRLQPDEHGPKPLIVEPVSLVKSAID